MSHLTTFTVLCPLLLVFIQTYVKVSGLRCLTCSSVDEPHDCPFVEECKSNELCAQQQPFGKRRQLANGNVRCVSCCNHKDVCNLDGQCGSTTFLLLPGYKLCYQCPLSSSPDNCNQLTLCDQNSNCMLMEIKNLLGETRWSHGCTQSQQCPALSLGGNNLCSFCCNSSLCNSRCDLPPIIESHTTTTSTITRATTAQLSLTKPKITLIEIQPQNIKYGDTVQITCVVTGNPTPSIDFMIRGTTLSANTHVYGNHLTILNYAPRDDGDFRCVATNALGDDMHQFSLHGHR